MKGIAHIVADSGRKRPYSLGNFSDDLSTRTQSAWEITRRLALRSTVQKARLEADGRVRADSANNYPDAHRLGPRPPEAPWYIHLTDDHGFFRLLCFDFDGKHHGRSTPELVDSAVDQANALSAELTKLRITHVLCESSSSGGRHIWIALAAGAHVDDTTALAEAAGLNYAQLDRGMLSNAKTGGARPPLSPHRNGSFSRILTGSIEDLLTWSTTLEQLRALTRLMAVQAPPLRRETSVPNGQVVAAHIPHRELSEWGARYMATAGGGSDPSRTGWMCLIAAAEAGWSFSEVAKEAESAPGMETFRTKSNGGKARRPLSRAQARARLETQWPKAIARAALHRSVPPAADDRDVQELPQLVAGARAVLNSFRIQPGRWGNHLGRVSERSVLAALAYLTLITGKTTVAAAERDLGPAAGVSATTASRALKALQEAGLVDLVSESRGINAAEYRLSRDFSTGSDITRPQPWIPNAAPPRDLFIERRLLVEELEQELTDSRHDLFTYEGLGHFAGKVFALIQPGHRLNLEEIRRTLGISHRHAVASLSLLRKNHLVIRAGNRWTRSKRDLRTAAAQILGVAGTLAARATTYQVDRDVWQWWQAEYATMTSTPRLRPRRPHVTSRPLFEPPPRGERIWPRYPRDVDGRADHRRARQYVRDGFLSPTSRIQLSA